jgi:hypothetical protein
MAAAEPDTGPGNTTRRFVVHGTTPPECLADPARVHPDTVHAPPWAPEIEMEVFDYALVARPTTGYCWRFETGRWAGKLQTIATGPG